MDINELKKKIFSKEYMPVKVVVAIILILLLLVGMSNQRKKKLVDKIFSAVSENSYTAIEKYSGKEIDFIAKVSSISANGHSIGVISVDADVFLVTDYITCSISTDKDKKVLSKLKSGDKVEIKGVLTIQSDSFLQFYTVDVESIKKK